MMVVFTKCKELENSTEENLMERKFHNPKRAAEVYSLKTEREHIDSSPVYKEVGEMVQVYENLQNAYVARLRMSPFGMNVEKEDVYLEDNSVNKNPDGSIKYPKPRQVDKLMHWLMVITGCVPAPAVFVPNPMAPEHVHKLSDVYVRRPQYRFWAPQGRTYEERVDEAMCRAYLFENYSEVDAGYIINYDDKSWRPATGSTGGNGGGSRGDSLIDRIRRAIAKGKGNT
jgi:hypothetical protein